MTPNVGREKKWCSNFSISCFTVWLLGRLHFCIHILSALFLLVSLFPANPRPHLTHSTFLHQSLVSASPFSTSCLTAIDRVFLQALHPSFSAGGWCSPLRIPTSFLLLSAHLLAGKAARTEWDSFLLTLLYTTPSQRLFPRSWISSSCGENRPLPSSSLSTSLLRWQGLHSWRVVGCA